MTMFKRVLLGCVLVLSVGVTTAPAADVKRNFAIQDALALEQVKNQLGGEIEFYWGDQAHPPVVKTFGTFKTSKRTNGFGKDTSQACAWALASSLVALKERAEREGGNAVVNIVSNIKDHEESSTTEYSCLAGSMMVNSALKGTVVTLQK